MKRFLVAVAGVAMLTLGLGGGSVGAASICDDLQGDPELLEAAGCNTTETIGGAANTVITIVLSMVGVIAVGVMIYGGVLYMTSSGDAAKAKRARDVILYGLVGLIVALLAFAIVTFVSRGVSG